MLPSDVPEYRVETKLSRVEHWRHLVEIVALVAAAVWAFYVFVYQEKIKPSGEPARLQPSMSVEHEPLRSGRELVTLNVSLKNAGSSDVAIAGLLVNAYGLRYDGSGKQDVARNELRADGIAIVDRGINSDAPELVYSHVTLWRPLGSSRTFNIPQGEQFALAMPFVLETGKYDTLRVRYAFCYQRTDDANASTYEPKRTSDGAYDITQILHEAGVHPGLHCGGTDFVGGEYAL